MLKTETLVDIDLTISRNGIRYFQGVLVRNFLECVLVHLIVM